MHNRQINDIDMLVLFFASSQLVVERCATSAMGCDDHRP